ncbi:MAG TPA: hypothetical protein VGN48_12680 [Pedococcus sp.]|uniref:hypothetical protein n=1 Tax=Lapillicoccus sp. TaxID=1909287 RepID=UPI002E08257E|nr:hypothetical protein [Pedococcus sp.]
MDDAAGDDVVSAAAGQKRAAEKSRSRQELEKSESILRGQLTKTEKALKKAKNRADRWRNEAQSQKRSALRARARLEKLKQKRHAAGPTRNRCKLAIQGKGLHRVDRGSSQ